MTAITWSDVVAIAPELSSVGASTQAAILADVYTEVVVDNWYSEARANRAAKYLAAHLATLTVGARGGAGPVQSRSVGQVSESFAVSVAEGSNNLDSTAYGKEYRRLLRLAFGGPHV